MPSKFADQLNTQIGSEFAAHQQYVAVAAYFETQTMPRMAEFFYRQALEERDHAMMMVQYLLDTGQQVVIPAVGAPVSSFKDIAAPVQLALEQEKRVTQEIHALTRTARKENDFAAEQFLQWFIKEQVEEVATMSDLLTVVNRSKQHVQAVEDYVAREQRAPADDPTAPPVAGA